MDSRLEMGRDVQRRGAPTAASGEDGQDSGAQRAVSESHELEQRRRDRLSEVAWERGFGSSSVVQVAGERAGTAARCDSTYELAFVVWALDHEIPFERNLEFFPYEYQGRLLRWMPDFRLADGTHTEIKGYLTDQARAKVEYFLRPLQVFTRKNLERMFDYVYHRYGSNLLALYE